MPIATAHAIAIAVRVAATMRCGGRPRAAIRLQAHAAA
jgi:hypothetical protein